MHAQETLLRPEAPPPAAHGISSAFPPEVLEQVRGRVRLLALLILVAFAFDLVIYAGNWAAVFLRLCARRSFFETSAFPARQPGGRRRFRRSLVGRAQPPCLGIPPSHARPGIRDRDLLHHRDDDVLAVLHRPRHAAQPDLGPAVVILFPLIMPGPPRRMLAAAIAAGAMSPLALVLLDLTGR